MDGTQTIALSNQNCREESESGLANFTQKCAKLNRLLSVTSMMLWENPAEEVPSMGAGWRAG
jgi:hypothetical protein